MNKIKLYADSTCDLNKELLNKYDISIIPLTVTFDNDDKTYRDTIDINVEDIKRKASEENVLPKTGATSPDTFQGIFQNELDNGNDVILVTISSDLSSNFNNAILGKCEVSDPHRVQVIDSRNLSTSQGILLIKLRHLIDEGKLNAKEIRLYAEEHIIPNLRCSFALQTIDYMAKGGRCSAVKAIVTKLLQLKPTISVIDGKLKLIRTPIGTTSKALDMIYDDMMEDINKVDPECVFVTHFTNEKVCDNMVNKIKELNIFKNIYSTCCGTIVGSHCGPNCIGILYLIKE